MDKDLMRLIDITNVCNLDKGNTLALEERKEIRELISAKLKVCGELFDVEPERPKGGINPQAVLNDF